jgi:hypothetical protein
MSVPTPYQQLARFASVTGYAIRLMPYDEILAVRIDDEPTGVRAVKIRRYKIRETKSADVATQASIILIAVGKNGVEEMVFPDPEFCETSHHRFTSRTEHEAQTRRLWEQSCGTPGKSRFGTVIQAERERSYYS